MVSKNQKRVLILSDFAVEAYGGTERFVMGIADWFSRKSQIIVDVLTPSKSHSKIKIKKSTVFKFPSTLASGRKRMNDYVSNFEKLVASGINYNIIHSFYTLPPMLAGIRIKEKYGKKVILNWFEKEPLEEHLKNPVERILYKKIIIPKLLKADKMVFLTSSLRNYMLKNFFVNYPKMKTGTIMGWVDRKFHPNNRNRQNLKGRKIILFVGRLTIQKGAFFLLEAFAKIKNLVDAEIVFVGPPYQKDEVIQQIKNLGISEYVKIVGSVSEKELLDWYHKSYIVSVPTLYKGAFGLSLIEGMACGKPVVGSDDLGLRDAIGNGGLVAKIGNVDSLAKALKVILTDKSLYNILRKNALARVERMFRKEIAMEKYRKMYEKVLKEN